jgi:hypothetical protein
MKNTAFANLMVILIALATMPWGGPDRAAAAGDSGTIAYVRVGTSSPSQIRLIQPDGGGDHSILSLPHSSADFVPMLAWRPDATELAFSSDHEGAYSLYSSDIYAIRPDGSHIRRLTNGPDRSRLASYPKGSVTVNVQIFGGGGPYLIYLAGAPEPKAVVGGSQTLTFDNVADFGPGRQQGVIAINGWYRWFGGAAADVQSGKTVSAGSLIVSGQGLVYKADRPTWRGDGTKIGFVFGQGGTFEQVPASPPDGALGTTLLDPDFPLGFKTFMEWAPLPSIANQVIYGEWDIDGGHIYRSTEASSQVGDLLVTYDAGEQLLDLKWLPDGSGFLFSLTGDIQSNSNIYEYMFATQATTAITHFTNEFAGHLSIAADSQSIVFERAATVDTPTDLWTMRRDGSGLQLLVANAARPAWSQKAPQAAPTFNTYLPFARR